MATKRTTSSKRRKPAASSSSQRPGSRALRHATEHERFYGGPWIVLGLALLAGQVLHLTSGGGWQRVVMVCLVVLATGGVAAAGWYDNRAASDVATWHTVATAILTGAWLVMATVTGIAAVNPHAATPGELLHVQWLTVAVWLVLGGAVATAWNVRQGILARDRVETEARGEVLDEWAEAGHPGVTGHIKRVNEYRSEGVLTLAKGDTLESLQRDAKAIESAHDWPHGSLSLQARGGRGTSRRIKAVIMHRDPLEEAVPWPGLAIGKRVTLFDPIPIGRRADGEVAYERVTTPEGGRHKLVMGMTGSGKSEGEKPVMLHTAELGATNVLIDTVKRTQSYGQIADTMHLFEIDPARAKAVLQRLIEHTVPERTQHLAREGLSAWSPKSSLPFLRIHLEEIWSLLGMDDVVDLSLALRSAGGQLVGSLQRATYDQMPPTLRGQLGTRRCYGLMEPEDAQYALNDRILDAVAANPADWADRYPGLHYLQQSGLTMAEQAMPVRAYTDTGAAKYPDVAARIAATLAPPCPIVVATLGRLWTTRTPPADLVTRRDKATAGPVTGQAFQQAAAEQQAGEHDVPRQRTVVAEVTDGTVEGEVVMATSDDGREVTFGPGEEDPWTVTFDDPDPYPGMQWDEDIEEQPDDREPVRFGRQRGKATQVEFDAAMAARLEELLESGVEEISASEFVPVAIETGWTRGSVYNRLRQWVSEALLVETGGEGDKPIRWRPVRSGAEVSG